MKQPIVCYIGNDFKESIKTKIATYCTPHFFEDDSNFDQIKKDINPHVWVTTGKEYQQYKNILYGLTHQESQKWVHFKNASEALQSGWNIIQTFVNYSIKYQRNPELISIFTTSYNSGDFIQRPYQSLIKQTYTNWEWVIVDDSNGDENWNNLVKLKESDPHRIRVYRPDQNSGVIGNVKHLASSLCRGSYVVELDHDDELTSDALQLLYDAGKRFPDAGFFYSDFTEIYEDGGNFSYGDYFSLGYGIYRKIYDPKFKKWINVCCSIPINSMTIRYLVSCPNHFRAWRTNTLKKIGGWNHNFHVADDYEIMVRSFLSTKMCRIPEMCYYQYRNQGGNNHTIIRNQEIQKLWKSIARFYNPYIHQRLLKLCGKDEHFKDWENHKQMKMVWLNPNYQPSLNYIYNQYSSPDEPLVSVVLNCQATELYDGTKKELLTAIRKIMKQSYQNLEFNIMGNACPILESVMNGLLVKGNLDNFNIDLDRVKQDIRWWNFSKPMPWPSSLNAVTKLINQGSIIIILNTSGLNNIDDKFVEQMVEKLNDSNFIDPITNHNHIVYKNKLHYKYGYWSSEYDLLEKWREDENQPLIENE